MAGPKTRLTRTLALLALLGLTALLGWGDVATGPDLAFSLFYLVPVVGAAWLLGPTSTALVAVTSGVAWLEAELILRPDQPGGVLAWNGLTRGVTFLVVGLLVSRLRAQRAHLTALNQELRESLHREETLARTDPLTGLPNRRAFREALVSLTSRARRGGEPLALLWLDLDNFKRLNDVYGHEAGDQALAIVAELFRRSTRLEDPIARLGGDEFAAALLGLRAEDAQIVGERLRDGVREAAARWPEASMGASVGVAWFPRPPDDPGRILREADAAMYQGKLSGKGRVVLLELSGPARDAREPRAQVDPRAAQA